jgi:hypothetical protein
MLVLVACSAHKSSASGDVSKLASQINQKNFVLNFNYAYPLRMNPVFLSSSYTLKIKGDSAYAYLPYYGVAHSAPYNPSEGGIKFQTKTEKYTSTKNERKRSWSIRFKARQLTTVYDLNLNVFDNGKAFLQVMSTDRDQISFNGEVEMNK